MRLNKFKIGDIVRTRVGNKGKILDVTAYSPTVLYSVHITPKNGNSYDAEMTEESLKFWEYSEEKKTNPVMPPKCPECGEHWTKTVISKKVYLDCVKCNDKAENLIDSKYMDKKRKEEAEFELDDYIKNFDFDKMFGP